MTEQEFFLRAANTAMHQFLEGCIPNGVSEKYIEGACRKSAAIATELTRAAIAEWEENHPIYPNSTPNLFNNVSI